AVQRLSPESPNVLTGGLRIRIDGVELPKDFVLNLLVVLTDQLVPDTEPIDNALPHTVPVINQVARVGIANGRYRASIRNWGSSYWGTEHTALSQLLELDFSGLPTEVEIHGDTLEFVIPATLV